jgi:hypothetical protein
VIYREKNEVKMEGVSPQKVIVAYKESNSRVKDGLDQALYLFFPLEASVILPDAGT